MAGSGDLEPGGAACSTTYWRPEGKTMTPGLCALAVKYASPAAEVGMSQSDLESYSAAEPSAACRESPAWGGVNSPCVKKAKSATKKKGGKRNCRQAVRPGRRRLEAARSHGLAISVLKQPWPMYSSTHTKSQLVRQGRTPGGREELGLPYLSRYRKRYLPVCLKANIAIYRDICLECGFSALRVRSYRDI